jgi:hypothetical protein
MGRYFVKVECDVFCDWHSENPRYRVFVNDELFVERTWIWQHHYLRECIQMQVNPGKYAIKIELVEPAPNATLTWSNTQIITGPATIKSGWLIKVHDES